MYTANCSLLIANIVAKKPENMKLVYSSLLLEELGMNQVQILPNM